MRWLVVGAAGMLGTDVLEVVSRHGDEVRGVDRTTLDVTDPVACAREIVDVDVVVNCAAWTAVDDAETQESAAFAVNALGAAHLARAAADAGARLVQVSTDYVFDGSASRPYRADDAPRPISAYGRTKLAGEWAVAASGGDHLVVRTAWLYGAGGPCFPATIARVARERGALEVVADQVGQPTWTADLADLIVRLVEAGAPRGIYHGTSGGQGSWCEFAQAVVEAAGMDRGIVAPTTSDTYRRPAPRPAWSVLSDAEVRDTGVEPIGDWRARWDAAVADPRVRGALLVP